MKDLNDFLFGMPGHWGEIARLIDDSLPYSEASISIPAALCLIATLKCGGVESEEGFEPNLYAATIAESGTGKTKAIHSIEDILDKVGLGDLQMRLPASEPGLLTALAERSRRLMEWDEFGISISQFIHSKDSPLGKLFGTVMELYSGAGRQFRGRYYRKLEEKVDINCPYLNIFAASTPDRFFRALTTEFVTDGFLARWFIFFPEGEKKKIRRPRTEIILTTELMDYLWKIEERSISTGNIGEAIGIVKKKVISLGESSKVRQVEWDKRVEKNDSEFERAFLRRAFEQYAKLCLILDDGDGNVVEPDISYYAAELVDYILARQFQILGANLGVEKSRYRDTLIGKIGTKEWVSASEIYVRTRRYDLSKKQRQELYNEFVENQIWRAELRLSNPDAQCKSPYYQRCS